MNRFLSDIEPASLALASVVLLVAALLGYREWLDRQARPAEMPLEDVAHFHQRDRRRSTGLSVLCILALGIVIGSRTPIRVGMQPNPLFLAVWLIIFGLILMLLSLSMVDWLDLRRFARRKKKAIGREQLALLQSEIDHWKSQLAREEREEGAATDDDADRNP